MLDKGNPSTRTGIPSNKQTNPIRTPRVANLILVSMLYRLSFS